MEIERWIRLLLLGLILGIKGQTTGKTTTNANTVTNLGNAVAISPLASSPTGLKTVTNNRLASTQASTNQFSTGHVNPTGSTVASATGNAATSNVSRPAANTTNKRLSTVSVRPPILLSPATTNLNSLTTYPQSSIISHANILSTPTTQPTLSLSTNISSSVQSQPTAVTTGASSIPQTNSPRVVPAYSTLPNQRSSCVDVLNSFPTTIEFNETDNSGLLLANVSGVSGLSLWLKVSAPVELWSILNDRFDVVVSNNTAQLVLAKSIDVEDIYLQTGRKVRLKTVQLMVLCKDQTGQTSRPVSTTINVTVWDVDDENPRFNYPGDTKTCVVPVYKADASETYTGILDFTPGRINAADGDLFNQHNITYKVMHADPEEYNLYFSFDSMDGSVNKTTSMNSSNPRKYVLIVQAVEDSPKQKSQVAIVSIVVFAPTEPGEENTTVNQSVLFVLRIVSAVVILGFVAGFGLILYHRLNKKRKKTQVLHVSPCDEVEPEFTPAVVRTEMEMKPAIAHYRGPSLVRRETSLTSRATPTQVVVSERSNTSILRVTQKPRQLPLKQAMIQKKGVTEQRRGFKAIQKRYK